MRKRNGKIHVALGLIMLLLITNLTGCSKSGTVGDINAQLDLAVKYLCEENYEQAILAYQEAIKIDPKAVQAYQGLAKVYTLQKNYDEAKAAYEQGLAAVADTAISKLKLGLASLYFDQGSYAEAEKIYKELMADSPERQIAMQGLVLLYQYQGDEEQALKILNQALAENRNSTVACNMLASIYVQQGEREKALDMLLKSLAEDINQAEAYEYIDNFFGLYPQEIEAQLAETDPHVSAMVHLYLLYHSDDYEGALAYYNDHLDDYAQISKAAVIAAMSAVNSGNTARAAELIQNVDASNLGADVLIDLARYYMATGNNGKAVELAEKCLEENEYSLAAVKLLYEIYQDKDEALASYYLVKFLTIHWMPLELLKQELYGEGIRFPGQGDDRLTFDYFIPELGKKYILKHIHSSQSSDGRSNNNESTLTRIWEKTGQGRYHWTQADDVHSHHSFYEVSCEGIIVTNWDAFWYKNGRKQTTNIIEGTDMGLKFVQPGQSWNNSWVLEYSFNDGNGHIDKCTETHTFQEIQKITIMGQEMEAAYVTEEGTFIRQRNHSDGYSDVDEGTSRTEVWYVKGLGLVKSVKSETYTNSGDGTVYGNSWTSELISVE